MRNVLCVALIAFLASFGKHAWACMDYTEDIIYTETIFIKCKERDLQHVVECLKKKNTTFLYQITNGTYAFKLPMSTRHEMNKYELGGIYCADNQIIEIQQGEELYPKPGIVPLERQRRLSSTYEHNTPDAKSNNQEPSDIVCSPYYDPAHRVQAAWDAGYTGNGVVIGIIDVGMDTDHPQLQENIVYKYSANFVDNSKNFKPEYDVSNPKSFSLTNHGNACGSVAAGVCANKTCDICGCGVAPDSRIAVLKVGVVNFRRSIYPSIESTAYAAALGFMNKKIHIYLCRLDFDRPFTKLDFGAEAAIRRGATHGRHGKGSIYLFPSGRPGNGFSNSIHTITVNSIAVKGTMPSLRYINSATLVSAFGDGKTRNDSGMCTSIHEKFIEVDVFCSHGFTGPSSATAMIAGMIALILEANGHLTLRDIKHILVESSSHANLVESPKFVKNSAGRFYHPAFGFGFPDVMKMIQMAKDKRHIPKQVEHCVFEEDDRKENQNCVVTLYEDCNLEIEQVTVDVWMKLPKEETIVLTLTSPYGTNATLLNTIINRPEVEKDKDTLLHVHTVLLANAFWGEFSAGSWRLELSIWNQISYSYTDLEETKVSFFSKYNEVNYDKKKCKEHCKNIGKTKKKETNTPTQTASRDSARLLPLVVAYMFTCLY